MARPTDMHAAICLITQNPGKLLAAKSVFDKINVRLVPAVRDFPEIQAPTSLEVARHTALEASREMNMPAIREDHSLFIDGLGLPGPYTSYWEKTLSAERMLDLLSKCGLRGGSFEVATVYADPTGKVIEHVFRVPMTFGTEIQGHAPRGWDGIIRLGNETRALTEYPESERLAIWNQGYEAIARQLP